MKVKTSELTGAALDWAVAHCEGIVWEQGDLDAGEYGPGFAPATDWAHGGPLIEREKIDVMWCGDRWCAYTMTPDGVSQLITEGDTPLIAAMRGYVTSTLGDEIDVPEDLRILAQAEQLQHAKDLEDFDPMERFVFDPNQKPMQLRQPQSLDIAEQLTKTK
jgi:hypothetical protein